MTRAGRFGVIFDGFPASASDESTSGLTLVQDGVGHGACDRAADRAFADCHGSHRRNRVQNMAFGALTWRLELPAAASLARDPKRYDRHPMSPLATTGTALRVLVVDDIKESRIELCELVQSAGHQALHAESGAEALALVQLQMPDLVLLDLLMPDVDGFEVTRRLRDLAAERWLPVIVTSALSGDEHISLALREGADDYLSRPVNVELLEAKLRHYGHLLRLQSRLRALAQRERTITDNVPDAIVTLDGGGRVIEANRAAHRLFGDGREADEPLEGLRCDAALGVSLFDLRAQTTLRLRRGDGLHFPAEVSISAWRDGDEERFTLLARDLTERQRIDRMKDEFLATVSHELRTPLTSIIGAVGLLAAGAAGALPAPAMALADVARRNGERLSRLIDDVLDLTKLEGQGVLLHLQPLDLGRLLREAVDANRHYADRAGGVRLVLDAPTEPIEVRADADRLLQVMANLLSNAVKHSPPREQVCVRVRRTADGARIEVADRGPGIAPAFRGRLFEKFSQADSSDRRAQGGTGLGLYISRLLVERMNGRIGVVDKGPEHEGLGAAFFVELPGTQASAQPWVLHVDRDVDARARVTDLLTGTCRVETVPDLAAARALLPQPALRLVIADPRAQELDADDFCDGLRELAPGVALLLYSDAVDADYAARHDARWLAPARSDNHALVAEVRETLVRQARRAARRAAIRRLGPGAATDPDPDPPGARQHDE
jgi:signal transduction histidine kinase